MAHTRLENYLRTYRRRTGLTQREVAFLLGCEDGAQISRYEKRKRVPPLQTALACEAVFGVPVSELFGGMRQTVGTQIDRRLKQLRSRLEAQPVQGREARLQIRKLQWLGERSVPATVGAKTTS
jgi:transcriptional regulator with XRE-family HTH domain